ncbi:MAG: alpha/beta fold hydrolase [Candidatus Hodarchaeales archaeon]
MDFDLIKRKGCEKQNLVFIHGAGGDKRQWDSQKEFFKKKGYGVLIPSLPQHGKTQGTDKVSVSFYSQSICDLIGSLKLDKIVLIGHSMGGAVAQRIVIDKMIDVESLILIGTGAKLNVAPIFFEMLENNFDEVMGLMGKFAYDVEASSNVIARNETIIRENGKEVLVEDFKACQAFDVRNELSKIKIPTLILVGENDKMTPVKYSKYLNEKIANSRIKIIPNSGHYVFQEQIEETNDSILVFLEKSEQQ